MQNGYIFCMIFLREKKQKYQIYTRRMYLVDNVSQKKQEIYQIFFKTFSGT